MNHDIEMTEEEEQRMWERAEEDRFLDLAHAMTIGAKAIHERRRLEERLAAAEADAKKWRDIAWQGTHTSMGMVVDMVTALGTGALTRSDDPEKRAAALALMEKRMPT